MERYSASALNSVDDKCLSFVWSIVRDKSAHHSHSKIFFHSNSFIFLSGIRENFNQQNWWQQGWITYPSLNYQIIQFFFIRPTYIVKLSNIIWKTFKCYTDLIHIFSYIETSHMQYYVIGIHFRYYLLHIPKILHTRYLSIRYST